MVCQMKEIKDDIIPWDDILNSETKDFYRLPVNPFI